MKLYEPKKSYSRSTKDDFKGLRQVIWNCTFAADLPPTLNNAVRTTRFI